MNYNYLQKKVKEYATYLLSQQLPVELTFHNLDHTLTVVRGAKVIGSGENLTQDEIQILEISALLHDTGYVDSFENHEDKSILRAKKVLLGLGATQEFIDRVCICIEATKKDSKPKSQLEKIMKDADTYHLASDNYFIKLKDLRKEWLHTEQKEFKDLEWYQLNLDFLLNHSYYTEFSKKYLHPAKNEMISKLKSSINSIDKAYEKGLSNFGVSKDELKKYKKKLLKAEERPERGIETLFRLTSKNHISLSGIADNKANIIITVNSIIISVLLGSLMQKLDNNVHLVPATIFLSLVNIFSIIFAILSLRPNITKGTFTKDDISNNKVNLLFFGNFHGMDRGEYHWGMNRLLESGKFLYSNLIDDIYFLGVVLAKKYKYLRTSYNVFMIGIAMSVVFFIISNFFAY